MTGASTPVTKLSQVTRETHSAPCCSREGANELLPYLDALLTPTVGTQPATTAPVSVAPTISSGTEAAIRRTLAEDFYITLEGNAEGAFRDPANLQRLADVAALKGKKVGVQNGTTHQKYLTDKHPEITTVPYDSYQNAILDLKNGRVDAVFGDTAVVNEWLKQNDALATVGAKVTDKDYFGTGLGIAVRQKNTDLQGKFNAALDKIKQDGTYETIYKKWFQQ